MPYNEAETRFHLIDPVLRDKSCNDDQWLKLETPAPVEPTGPKGRRRKGVGRTDYLLCVQVGDMPKPLPVGVLEAKKENEDPLKGMQQAKAYAECKRFDVKYVFATNGQQHIVARVQAAMNEIDALGNFAKAALDDINRLPSRVLAQAFNQQGDNHG